MSVMVHRNKKKILLPVSYRYYTDYFVRKSFHSYEKMLFFSLSSLTRDDEKRDLSLRDCVVG
jgi:hypothetical protein